MPFKPRSRPIRKSGRPFITSLRPRKSGSRPKACGYPTHFGRRFGWRAEAAQPDAARISALPTIRLEPIEGFIVADQLLWNSGGRQAEIKRQAARTDARRGPRRGAQRIRRAQRQPCLHRLSAAAAAGGDRAGQCRPSTNGSLAIFVKVSPAAPSRSLTSSRPKSACSPPALASPRRRKISIPRRSSSRR